jgi:PIN domain nuclease of toxin-antitoxin system
VTVLDASAVLALIHEEPGGDLVEAALSGAVMSTVNLAEVVGKLVDADVDASRVRPLLASAGVSFVPLSPEDAELAGALRAIDGGTRLSLGDRCCLALAASRTPPEVLTADRYWADVDLPVSVRLIR